MFARFMIFFFGLCVLSLGIATVTNAGLGTGTVSSVAFVLNRLTDFSMGFFVFLIGHYMGIGVITNIVQVVVGMIIYLLILIITKDDILMFLFSKAKELVLKK